MEIDENGNVLNCYGICPDESSEYYDLDCETNLSLYISTEINEDTEEHRYIQNQEEKKQMKCFIIKTINIIVK